MMFVARNQKTLKRIGSFKITIGHMLRRNLCAKNALLFGLVAHGWSGDISEHTKNKKNTGVKKCQIFCAVRNVPESPHNIKILLDLLRVEKLPVSFLFDLNVTSL